MIILELAVQGVKGLAPSVRVALKQGYTLLQAQQPGGSLWRLFENLWYADGRGDASAFLAPGASQARAGLTFQGRDGATYRLVRDLGGQGTLAKMDAGTGKFAPITTDATEIAQYLRSTVGLPTRGAFEQAFAIGPGGWPSQQVSRPSSVSLPKISGSHPALQVASPGLMQSSARSGVQPAADVTAARATLVELRKELDGVKELDEIQFKADGLQKRAFDLGAQVREVQRLEKELAAAAVAVEGAPSPSKLGLPDNIGERAARVEVLEKQRDDQLKRLEREREQFLGKSFSVEPIFKDPAFAASMIVGVLSLVVGAILGHAWRYLCLFDIPAFGMAAVLGVRWVGELQSIESLSRRKSHYDDREKQLNDAFENEVLSVKTAMKLLGVETPGELIDVFAGRQLLERQMQDAQSQLDALANDPAVALAQRELVEIQGEQSQLDVRIGQLAGYGRPLHVVEAEIEDVEASIQAALSPAAAAPAPAAVAVASPPTGANLAVAPSAPPAEDPIPRLLDATTDLFGADLATLCGLISARAAQYLAALTERRFSGLELNARGQATVTSEQGRVAAGALSGVDRDLLFLAVKVSLMEKYAESARLPCLIDDDFAAFSPNQIALIGRVLKHLGTRAQVVHLTASVATEALADARFAV